MATHSIPQKQKKSSLQSFLQSDLGKRIIFIGSLVVLVAVVLYLGSQKNFKAPQYIQLILDGLRGGTIYALMLGAMLAVTIFDSILPLPDGPRLVVACIGAILITTLIGVVVERLTIYPARNASPLTLIIITVGVYIAIQGIALLLWGTDAYSLPAFTTLEMRDKTIRLGSVIIKAQSFWIWGTTAVVLAGLAYFFDKTMWGKGLRACAVNKQAARLMGISPSRMSILAFGLAAALGAIAGVVVAPVTRPTYDMGLSLGLKGFVAAIMGGLVNPPAAVVGGLLLGVIENVGAGVTKAGLKDIFAFIILIVILIFKPSGLLGRKTTEKV